MWLAFLFSILLLGLAVGLIASHVRTYRAATIGGLDEKGRLFFKRQYRRRMLSSSAIGVVGVAMSAGLWIRHPVAALLYWGFVTLTVCWIGLLGVADWVSAHNYYRGQAKEIASQQGSLKEELRRLQRAESDEKDEE